MSVSPFPTVVTLAWRCLLLLFCLLAGASCAARGRPAAVPTFTATPTFPPTPTLTPSAQVEGVYANLESTRSAVQHAARQQPQVLFTLPPAFRPPFPVLRRVVGQPVLIDGSLDPAHPDPRPFRLQLAPDGAVRYLDHPDVEGVGYLAYSLHLTWGTTAAANDLAVLDILAELTRDISHPVLQFADGRLTSLSLRVNQLTALPPEIGQLQHLTTLNLWMNQLTALPPAIGQLHNLTHLDLRGNQLTALVPELSQLTNLTSLDLASNQLTALPPAIGQLHNLNTLGLSSNQLIDLPSELGQLANLESLGLHGNRLTALSPALGQLANLEQLYLHGNRLTTLPPEIGQLQNLSWLSLRGTQLTALPPEFGQLQNLYTLDLRENPLSGCLPADWRNLEYAMHFSEPLPFCTD